MIFDGSIVVIHPERGCSFFKLVFGVITVMHVSKALFSIINLYDVVGKTEIT